MRRDEFALLYPLDPTGVLCHVEFELSSFWPPLCSRLGYHQWVDVLGQCVSSVWAKKQQGMGSEQQFTSTLNVHDVNQLPVTTYLLVLVQLDRDDGCLLSGVNMLLAR